ncbi:MAG TPA: hypothetical protein IAB55_04240 [Candidatus Merdivicinus faecavium]|nr:hypothetical protein [Candidatus Merdivicinus faecavium]
MLNLAALDELIREAPHALYTREQAVQVSLMLLKTELNRAGSANEADILRRAIDQFTRNFRYLDPNQSETDRMLDSLGVARLRTEDIVEAIKAVLFDAE